MIAIIDYGMGNVRSIFNALEFIGEDSSITSDAGEIADASHVILPGVGAFGDAIKELKARGLDDILTREVVEKGKPFLGVCLGLQLLVRQSDEHGLHEGFGWFDAEVKRFQIDDLDLRVPHVGWNNVAFQKEHPVFKGIPTKHSDFYFVHSHHIVCSDPSDILATCEYGYEFVAAIARDNIVAFQFHPEKSQDNGIQSLENFVEWKG